MSLSPEREGLLTPAAFDRNGLRLSVEPEARATPPRTPPPQMQEQFLTPGGPRPTMAVLIIKPHATKQRLKIEKRILEAGFEILKERKMGFHLDGSGVVELFGPDAPSLSGEPVWVYVLSRPRSASVLSALVGPLDPLAARRSDPECLRALYGSNRWENGVWTTRDESSAERIVSELFAGSPIMELSDLPSAHSSPDRRRVRKTPSHSGSIRSHLSSENRSNSNSRGGSVPPPATVAKSPAGSRARPAPSATASPSIVPRTTRAADLRAGNAAPPPPRQRQSQEERERTFEGVPGHKRRESFSVASTAAPTIAPRQNRSAMLRAQKQSDGDSSNSTRFPSMSDSRERRTMSPEELEEKNRTTFEGVPGHKRRESIKVASTATPIVAPRPNRSSLLRAQKMAAGGGSSGPGGAPPSSFKGSMSESGPARTLSTRSSVGSIGASTTKADRRASIAIPRQAPATVSTAASKRLSLALPSQPNSNSNTGGALTPISNGTRSPRPASVNSQAPKVPPKMSPNPKKPDIEPRTNKSALLRAAAKLKSAAGASVGKSTSRKNFAF
ncbi:Nucleoside diphosphate kinase, partial [Rhizoctonia solani]